VSWCFEARMVIVGLACHLRLCDVTAPADVRYTLYKYSNWLNRERSCQKRRCNRVYPVAASRLWNTLPQNVTSAPPITVFMKRPKTYFFNRSLSRNLPPAQRLRHFGHYNRFFTYFFLLNLNDDDTRYPCEYVAFQQSSEWVGEYSLTIHWTQYGSFRRRVKRQASTRVYNNVNAPRTLLFSQSPDNLLLTHAPLNHSPVPPAPIHRLRTIPFRGDVAEWKA